VSFSLKTVVLGMLVASLFVAAGCGDSDKKSSSTPGGDSREELAQKASLVCETVDTSALKLAANPGTTERDEIRTQLQSNGDQAAVVASDASRLPDSRDRAVIRTAARNGGQAVHALEDVTRDPSDIEAVRKARSDFTNCVTSLKAAEKALDLSSLTPGLSSAGFDKLLAAASTTTTNTTTTETQTTTTGPGPNGGETSDLPLCSDSPPPCRTAGGGVEAP
jgi:hypothetical protein